MIFLLCDGELIWRVLPGGGERVGVGDRYLRIGVLKNVSGVFDQSTRLQRTLQRQRIMQASWVEQGQQGVALSVSLGATHGSRSSDSRSVAI